MTSIDLYARSLQLSNLLRGPALASAVAFLRLSPGSRGLDAGCGVGLHTPLLAEAVQSRGYVVGLDASPGLLAFAPPHENTSFTSGEIQHLPFSDQSFDWLWSVDTVYPGAVVTEPGGVMREFRRVVKPGGRIALLFWSAQKLLPGYPKLEAALEAAFVATVPYLANVPPENHFLRASAWLRDAGLQDVTARTFVADMQGPFDAPMVEALAGCFEMFWGHLQPHLSPEVWTEFERLCRPDSVEFVVQQPGYHAFLTYALFVGKVAQ